MSSLKDKWDETWSKIGLAHQGRKRKNKPVHRIGDDEVADIEERAGLTDGTGKKKKKTPKIFGMPLTVLGGDEESLGG